MNLCVACGKDFASVEGFDRHRVGKHAYLFAEGLRMTPLREDGRRCLDVDELRALGWQLDKQGRWYDPAKAARTREAFSALDRSPQTASEGAMVP